VKQLTTLLVTILTAFVISWTANAAEIGATTDEGKRVLLKDDMTWEYTEIEATDGLSPLDRTFLEVLGSRSQLKGWVDCFTNEVGMIPDSFKTNFLKHEGDMENDSIIDEMSPEDREKTFKVFDKCLGD